MKIKAALLTAPHANFDIEDLELDEPQHGEVLVRIAATGVCHSDWHLVSGDTFHPMPCVAGHEGAGIVEALGSGVGDVQIADHVILNWAPSCGTCFYCSRGKSNLCDTYTKPIWAGTMLDGKTRLHRKNLPVYHYCGLASFAEYVVVPRVSVVPIRKDVPLESACLVGCAVASGVGAAMYTAKVQRGESVVVIGCGGVGLNIIQGARICGADPIIAVDANERKMHLAKQFGATACILTRRGDARATSDEIRKLSDGRGADHAFEAVGIPDLQELAFDSARPGGTVVLAGLSKMGTSTNFPGAVITREEKTIRGSYYGSVHAPRDFPMLIDLYAQGKLKLDELISRRWKLDSINEAFAEMLTGNVARGVIVPAA